jgi:hypothetical protein
MNTTFCSVLLSVIQGIALNTGVPPLSKGGALQTVGAHHGVTRGGDRSQVLVGIPIDSQREGRLRPCLKVRHLRLRQ